MGKEAESSPSRILTYNDRFKKKEVSDVNVYVSDGNVCYNVGEKNAILKVTDAAASLISVVSVSGKGVLENLNKGIYFISVIADKAIKVFKIIL